jgi:hypothetical protein
LRCCARWQATKATGCTSPLVPRAHAAILYMTLAQQLAQLVGVTRCDLARLWLVSGVHNWQYFAAVGSALYGRYRLEIIRRTNLEVSRPCSHIITICWSVQPFVVMWCIAHSLISQQVNLPYMLKGPTPQAILRFYGSTAAAKAAARSHLSWCQRLGYASHLASCAAHAVLWQQLRSAESACGDTSLYI